MLCFNAVSEARAYLDTTPTTVKAIARHMNRLRKVSNGWSSTPEASDAAYNRLLNLYRALPSYGIEKEDCNSWLMAGSTVERELDW